MKNLKIENMEVNGKQYYPRIQGYVEDPAQIKPQALPVGRISVDNENQSLASVLKEFLTEYSSVDARFPLEYLGVMQNLSIANPDVSQMVDNIIQLGNTGHKVIVKTKNEGQEQVILEELNSFGKTAFHRFGGLDGFVNSCLGQIARTGAVSAEWVVEENLNGLEKVVFVPVCSIRFVLDRERGEYLPHQKVSEPSYGLNNLIPLNIATYQYVALQLLDNSPYAIPPIMAALEAIMVQRDIVKNFKFVAKKMGLLGFVTFLLKAPQKNPGEKDDVYIARMKKYLDDQAEQIKSNYRDGLAIGFKDSFEVNAHSLMQSAPGATEIFKNIEEQVFSGLKSDPALHGRTYSTTETYAGVVYEKMLQIITNYQRPVKQVLEYGFKLHLNLMGMEYEELYIEFQASKSLSSERDEATYSTKIDNLIKLYNQGIIDQNQFAQEAGYDNAAEDTPRAPVADPNAVSPPQDTQNQSKFIFSKSRQAYILVANKSQPEEEEETLEEAFNRCQEDLEEKYGHCECATEAFGEPTEAGLAKLKAFITKYFRAVFPNIRLSRKTAVNKVIKALEKFPLESADSSLFAETVYDNLASTFGETLASTSILSNITKNVNTMYRYFRLQDASPFETAVAPIRPSFKLVDGKAVKFLRDSDNFYFGKYLTDPATRSNLKKWLENEYLRSGKSLRDKGEMALFRKKFGDRVAKEDYKVLRVVETSASRAKNWGNVLQVEQSGATVIQIAGPKLGDGVTCAWCGQMVGKTFKVPPVVQHVKDVLERDPEDLPQLSPFLPGKIHPAVLKDTSEEQLLAQGIALPPYHPHCRHRFIVVGFDDD